MECNKEEAIRAKAIAEKKMESKDFVGARKIAIKAQRLYPDMENISQMICVCDVHCSAESKSVGSEKDWYDILKVEQSADEVSIKKQYRKLALLLHPDKNKFAGAEAAFMLIGEAQKVLIDKENRAFFDARYKRFSQNTAANPPPPPQANKKANNVKPPSGQTNTTKNASSNVNKQPQQQQQANAGVSSGSESFWTACPFCLVRFRYNKIALNRNLLCQSCKKNFIAYDMCAESTNPKSDANQGNSGQPPPPSGSNANKTATHSQGGVNNQGGSCSASNGRVQGTSGQQKPGADSFAKSGQSTQAERSKKTNELNMGAKNINRTASGGSNHSRANIGKKEKKQVVEPKGSLQSKGGTSSKGTAGKKEGGTVAGSGSGGDSSSRQHSSQSKRHTSNNGIGSDDGTLNSSKRLKTNAQSSSPAKQTSPSKVGSTNFTKRPGSADESDRSAKETPNGNDLVKEKTPQRSSKVDKSAKDKPDDIDSVKDNNLPKSCKDDESGSRMVADVPDSEFHDFDVIREEDNFKVGQVWAVYDTLDAMPRFYSQIRKVFTTGFKLRITWLEPDPDEVDALQWADNELPFSCGKFMTGSSENTEDRLTFSHPVCWERGQKGSIMIHPRKGETWALMRDWHMNWACKPDDHKAYEYEFVEILSDYDVIVGVRVAFLGKLKGFSCLFLRKGGDEIQIPPSEYLRFSHRVPSHRMTGEEREGVPKGSFELDPASLPLNLEDMTLPEEMKSGMAAADHSSISGSGLQGQNPGVVVKENESGSGLQGGNSGVVVKENEQMMMDIDDKNQSISSVVDEHAATESSSLEPCELPEPEFFNFDAMRVLDMFQIGQVWALYSDAAGLPNFYGQIKKVDHGSEFKLEIEWLEAFSLPNNLKKWRNNEMPIGCGKFKIKNRNLQGYHDPSPFSHELRVETLKTGVFEICPRKGEIWALYKNWNVDMTLSDLETCEYDFVEILQEGKKGSHTKVLALEQVPGYNSVFKAKMSGSSSSTMEIPHNELVRFSHQIPSHTLTEEKDGSLRGFKELDPSAFPASFFLPKVR